MVRRKYEVVFIDWDKTLSSFRFWGHWQNRQHHYHHLFRPVTSKLFKKKNDYVNCWMRGAYSTEEVISLLAKELRLETSFLLNEFIQSCQSMEFASPKIVSLALALRKKGLKVNVATDNMDCFTRWTAPALKLDEIFDDILNSFNLRALKTDRGKNGQSLFFSQYFLDNGINPNRSILIDDSSANCCLFENLGGSAYMPRKEADVLKILNQLATLP